MSDLILGLFLAPEIETKLDKKVNSLKPFQALAWEIQKPFPDLEVSYGLSRSECAQI